MKKIRTCRELIEAFGDKDFGPEVFPDSKDPFRASRNAKLRGTIGVARWRTTIDKSASRGIEVTLDQLAQWRTDHLNSERARREKRRKKQGRSQNRTADRGAHARHSRKATRPAR